MIERIDTLTIDESMIAYQPGKVRKQKASEDGEPIPVMWIKKKPHPNGLVIYHVCTFIEHPIRKGSVIPFIVDTLPHLKSGDSGLADVVKKVMKR